MNLIPVCSSGGVISPPAAEEGPALLPPPVQMEMEPGRLFRNIMLHYVICRPHWDCPTDSRAGLLSKQGLSMGTISYTKKEQQHGIISLQGNNMVRY